MNTEIEKYGIEDCSDSEFDATNELPDGMIELLRTVKASDTADDASESADRVFAEVLRRIDADERSSTRHTERRLVAGELADRRRIDADARSSTSRMAKLRVVLRFVAAACLAVAAIGTAYVVGRDSGERMTAGTPVVTVAPRGALTSFALSDGTSVKLNGGSRLSYPASFGDGQRRVTLSGEAFFDVAKDSEHPFVVEAEHVAVKVLGTRFAVKCYDGDSLTTVVVEEGVVEASPSGSRAADEKPVLHADCRMSLDNGTGEFRLSKVDAAVHTAWKDGVLHFDNLTLDEIARIVERRFNVKIAILDADLASERYFASFRHGETVERILETLARKHSWYFAVREDTMEIGKR